MKERCYLSKFLIDAYFVSHLRRVYDAFDGDMECALVLGEIGHYNVREHLLSGDRVPVEYLADGPLSILKGCNANSISMASGIPRETVRRKIVKLESLGWIIKNDKGHLFVTQKVATDFDSFSMETIELFNELMRRIECIRS